MALGVGVLVVLSLVAPAALAADPVTVTITNRLEPAVISVAPGTAVTWRNADGERHRIRSISGPEEFDTGNLDPGEAATFTFNAAGTYQYLDDRNDDDPAYQGTIVVLDGTGPAPPPAPGPGGGDATVDIVNRAYRPPNLTVAAGTRVSWTNIDDRPHTVTARDRSFDSGIFDTGGAWARTFSTPGTFDYFCTLHPDMVATVVVTGTGGEVPPPAPAPPPPAPPPPAPPPPAPAGDINIFDNGYSPSTRTVPVGTSLTWSNTGALPHTVTRSGSFDSGILMPGDTYRRTFNSAGTFSYLCTIHPDMVATVVVTGTGGEASPDQGVIGDEPDTLAPAEPSAPAGPSTVVIFDNGYDPGGVTVPVGTSLTWSNTGALPHTVTDSNGAFDSGFLMTGDTYRRTFNSAGTFSYLCTIHPEMVATVTVTVAGSGGGTGGIGQDGSAGESALVRGDPATEQPGRGSAAAAAAAESEVAGPTQSARIIDLDYLPGTMTVVAGTTVTWTNKGALPHTVTDRTGEFDSGIMSSGGVFDWTFGDVGTFEYFCTLHPDMVGTVIVQPAPQPIVETSGLTPTGGSGGPSMLVAAVLASSVAAFGIALAGGMALFAKYASAAETASVSGARRRK